MLDFGWAFRIEFRDALDAIMLVGVGLLTDRLILRVYGI